MRALPLPPPAEHLPRTSNCRRRLGRVAVGAEGRVGRERHVHRRLVFNVTLKHLDVDLAQQAPPALVTLDLPALNFGAHIRRKMILPSLPRPVADPPGPFGIGLIHTFIMQLPPTSPARGQPSGCTARKYSNVRYSRQPARPSAHRATWHDQHVVSPAGVQRGSTATSPYSRQPARPSCLAGLGEPAPGDVPSRA